MLWQDITAFNGRQLKTARTIVVIAPCFSSAEQIPAHPLRRFQYDCLINRKRRWPAGSGK